MNSRLIVGISGGSGAGKHRVIREHLLPALRDDAVVLEHDWYYHELPTLMKVQAVTSREDINYDQPSAYENELLGKHIDALAQGRAVHVHKYQKGLGMRRARPSRFEAREVIIIDGMMVFAVPELVERMTIRAYVHADDEVRWQRRVERDMGFSTVEESRLRFERDVLPAHKKYVEPSRDKAHFILDNNLDGKSPQGVDVFLAEVLQALMNLRRKQRLR